MKKVFSILTVATLLSSAVIANEHSTSHWGYTGHNSPESWGHLSEKYHQCSDGLNQSPINITYSIVDSHHLPLNLDYKKGSKEVINNGHTVQVNVESGDILMVDGKRFELKQFHFHSPSENQIDGKSFPLEAHFVHVDKDGNIAVVAIMFIEGEENKELAKIWKVMPEKEGKVPLNIKEIATNLIPEKQHYYRFNGSLTTPPCTEGVRWFVLEKPLTISKAQIEKFQHIMQHPNNRPVQPINARIIIKEYIEVIIEDFTLLIHFNMTPPIEDEVVSTEEVTTAEDIETTDTTVDTSTDDVEENIESNSIDDDDLDI